MEPVPLGLGILTAGVRANGSGAVATHYWYSRRRHGDDMRGRNAEQADGIVDVERQQARGRGRSDLFP